MKITHSIAQTYGAELAAAELAWQGAVAGAGRNLAALAEAGTAGGVGISIVNELVAQSLAGLGQLAAAGETYAAIHDRVAALARLSGLEPTSYGTSTAPARGAADPAMPAIEPTVVSLRAGGHALSAAA